MKLRDRQGNPITFRAIRPGQVVRIEGELFQTMNNKKEVAPAASFSYTGNGPREYIEVSIFIKGRKLHE